MSMPPPGWYPDPADERSIRYWDGASWTDRVQPRTVPPPPAAPPGPSWPQPLDTGGAPAEGPAPDGPAAPGQGYPPAPGTGAAHPSGGVQTGSPPEPASAQTGYPPGGQPYAPYGPYAPAPPMAAPPGRLGPDGQVLAGWWRRVGGYLLDGLVVGIPTALAAVITASVIGANGGTILYEDRAQDIADRILAGEQVAPTELFDVLAPGFWTLLVVSMAVYLIVSLINGVYLISRSGQTVGDRAVAVRKVMAGRAVPSLGTALARWLIPNVLFGMVGQVVPLGFLLNWGNYLWPLWDGKSQTLHDKMVRTYVERADLAGPPVPRG